MTSGSFAASTKSGGPCLRAYAAPRAGSPAKAVTEEEFLEAVKKFENAPMRGSSGKKEVKK